MSVEEVSFSTLRRVGASAGDVLAAQSNLASTYQMVRRHEQALRARREVYHGYLKLKGEEDENTLREAGNLATSLRILSRCEEAKSLLRKMIPIARRVLGESKDTTLRMRWMYAEAPYSADGATLEDIREAVNELEDTERTARRVLGGAHPITGSIEKGLQQARETLAAFAAP